MKDNNVKLGYAENPFYLDGFDRGFVQGIARVENILRDNNDFDALRTIKNVFNGIDKMISDSDDFVAEKKELSHANT